ncbi:MAG: T9SS type A sorting domain-containing protein, partial [candidate division WOR-3 bacterium]
HLGPGDPRPHEDAVWILYANRDYLPAPANARIQITPTPAAVTVDEPVTLNVKVVPNPYIITNEWQQSFVQRRMRFINLPGECTIRIFTLNGELVKAIKHHHTSSDGVLGDLGGDEWWDVLNENRELVASGVYIFHIDSEVGEQVGKFVIIR